MRAIVIFVRAALATAALCVATGCIGFIIVAMLAFLSSHDDIWLWRTLAAVVGADVSIAIGNAITRRIRA